MSTSDSADGRAEQLALPIKYVGITFLQAILANVIVILFLQESPLVYAVIPFNLAFVFAVAWLAKVAYSWFMAIITVLLVLFPLGFLIIMLLAYNRASKELKNLGYKVGFSGALQPI
ncbi:MAG: hypothetical protein CVV07_10425 [Gammaproteobacteria bacterium HGW-Gammaproteobacteria-11]|nr:MAG: hypothetical protein CVV07_10425 [Gammaproteobacteria bacterium HGW-Gammaproteobacteria-11]